MSHRARPEGAHETLYRQWLMLRSIPRAPRKIDPANIEARLREQGIAIDRRSIQRDLHKLATLFPLVCDDRSKPYGWSFSADAAVMDVPGMDPHTALLLSWRLPANGLGPNSCIDSAYGLLDRHKVERPKPG